MSRHPIGETAMTGAERARRYRLKHPPVTNGVTKQADPDSTTQLTEQLTRAEARIRDLEAELARAKAEIAGLRAELGRERQRHGAAEAKAQKPPLTEAERETKAEIMIKGLRTQLRHRQAELRSLVDWKNTTGIPEKGGMSRTTYVKVAKALHPDSTPSDADRAEGVRAFNAWVDELKTAVRRRSA